MRCCSRQTWLASSSHYLLLSLCIFPKLFKSSRTQSIIHFTSYLKLFESPYCPTLLLVRFASILHYYIIDFQQHELFCVEHSRDHLISMIPQSLILGYSHCVSPRRIFPRDVHGSFGWKPVSNRSQRSASRPSHLDLSPLRTLAMCCSGNQAFASVWSD